MEEWYRDGLVNWLSLSFEELQVQLADYLAFLDCISSDYWMVLKHPIHFNSSFPHFIITQNCTLTIPDLKVSYFFWLKLIHLRFNMIRRECSLSIPNIIGPMLFAESNFLIEIFDWKVISWMWKKKSFLNYSAEQWAFDVCRGTFFVLCSALFLIKKHVSPFSRKSCWGFRFVQAILSFPHSKKKLSVLLNIKKIASA